MNNNYFLHAQINEPAQERKRIDCVRILAVTAGLLILVNLVRTVLILLEFFRYHPCITSEIQNHTNVTQLFGVNQNDALGNPPSYESVDIYRKLSLITFSVLSFLHVFEYLCLFLGIYAYCKHREFEWHWHLDILDILKDLLCPDLINTWSEFFVYLFRVVALLVVMVYLPIALTISFLGIYNDKKYLEKCNREENWWIGWVYGFLTACAHTSTFLTRCFMIWMCREVRSIFKKGSKTISEVAINPPRDPSAFRVASTIHKKLTDKYQEVAGNVSPVINIFSSWFFIVWIIYTIGTIDDLGTLIRAWTTTEIYTDTEYAYEAMYVAYDLLSYSIPFICGALFNSYHDEYYNTLIKRQPKGLNPATSAEDIDLHYHTTLLQIKKRQDCTFVPMIWIINIKLPPLESILYAIPVITPTISLIWGFTAKS